MMLLGHDPASSAGFLRSLPVAHASAMNAGNAGDLVDAPEAIDDGRGRFHSGGNVAIITTFASRAVADGARDVAGGRSYPASMLADWLRKSLKTKNVAQADLARQLTARLNRSIDRSAVNKMALGKRGIAADEMLAIADILGVDPPANSGSMTTSEPVHISPSSEALVEVRIVGKVEAGAFRQQDDLGDWDGAETIVDVRDSRFPNARHLCFDVEGDSMNALKPRPILPGDRVFALAYEDIAHEVPLRDGMIVIVERTRYSGQEREWSVKQMEIYEDRVEFHPRSSNPRHKPIIVKRDNTADDGMTVEIIAIVRGVKNEFRF